MVIAMSVEQPVIGIARMSRIDIGTNVPPLRTVHLLQRGARVVLLGGKQNIHHDPDTNEVNGQLYEVTLDREGKAHTQIEPRIGAVVVRALLNTNRGYNSGRIPALNAPDVRQAADKRFIYTGPLAVLSPQTKVLQAGADARDIADHFTADKLVVKPASGSGGRDIAFVSAAQVAAEIEGRWRQDSVEDIVVQERVVNMPWPATIRAFNPDENARLHNAVSQELRMFDVNNKYIPIARVVDPGSEHQHHNTYDTYVALDPNTVPPEAYTAAQAIRTGLTSGGAILHTATAIDLSYGIRPSRGEEPEWLLVEANTLDPQFPKESQYFDLAHSLNDQRSQQLVCMATTGVQ